MKTLFNLDAQKNVNEKERIMSAVAGGFLLAYGFKRGQTLSGMPLAAYLLFRGISGYCPVKERLSGNSLASEKHNVNIKTRVTINRPRNEVYSFWRKLENLSLFMNHLQSVTVIDDKRSLWKAKIPGSFGTIDWESEIVDDQVNERIGWRSLPESEIMNAGNVQFREYGPQQTEVFAIISYEAPGGIIGESLGKLLKPVFKKIVRSDIERLKEYLEGTYKTEGV